VKLSEVADSGIYIQYNTTIQYKKLIKRHM